MWICKIRDNDEESSKDYISCKGKMIQWTDSISKTYAAYCTCRVVNQMCRRIKASYNYQREKKHQSLFTAVVRQTYYWILKVRINCQRVPSIIQIAKCVDKLKNLILFSFPHNEAVWNEIIFYLSLISWD